MTIDDIVNGLEGRWKSKDGTYYLFSLTDDEWQPLEISPPNKFAESYYFKVLREHGVYLLQLKDDRGQIRAVALEGYPLQQFYLVTPQRKKIQLTKVR